MHKKWFILKKIILNNYKLKQRIKNLPEKKYLNFNIYIFYNT